jgi:hypothetical protein
MSQYPQYPQYPQQPMQPPPAPKKPRRGKYFAIGCGVLIVLVLLIGVIAAVGSNGTATSTDTSATQPASATQAPTTPPVALKWATTHTFTGNGTKKTAVFTVPGDWKILYSCVAQAVGDGTFVDGLLGVTVTGTDNTPIDIAVNATCKSGTAKTTGETEEHQGGQVYLDVNGTGDWTIQVQELK